MPRQNRFWNRRAKGVCGACIQLWRAYCSSLADRLSTYLTGPNLRSSGEGVVIQRGVVIRYPGQIELNDHVRIGRDAEIDSDSPDGRLTIGAGTWIGRRCRLDFTGDLVIGSDCTLSEGVIVLTHDHGLNPRSKPQRKSMRIGRGVWIGANAIVLPNVSQIGDGCIIGSGAVVTKPVPPRTIVAGNPARTIRGVGEGGISHAYLKPAVT
jgi:acetyltransferase-like isoleucine patch superfamily enzyme